MDQYTYEGIIKLLRKYVGEINKKFKIEKAILFGSRARGDALNTSDVDLILISKDFQNLHFRKRMAIVLEGWDADLDIEVLCYTPGEFERKKKEIGIIRTAVEEGIEI